MINFDDYTNENEIEHAKDPYEAKYQNLINKREKVGLNHYDDPKAFVEYSSEL